MQLWTVNLKKPDWPDAPEAQAVCGSPVRGRPCRCSDRDRLRARRRCHQWQGLRENLRSEGPPAIQSLISHVPDLDEAQRHGRFNDLALQLANAFWPGPLTLVVPKKDTSPISDMATAGLETVALRVPDGPVMRLLAERTGRPLGSAQRKPLRQDQPDAPPQDVMISGMP